MLLQTALHLSSPLTLIIPERVLLNLAVVSLKAILLVNVRIRCFNSKFEVKLQITLLDQLNACTFLPSLGPGLPLTFFLFMDGQKLEIELTIAGKRTWSSGGEWVSERLGTSGRATVITHAIKWTKSLRQFVKSCFYFLFADWQTRTFFQRTDGVQSWA